MILIDFSIRHFAPPIFGLLHNRSLRGSEQVPAGEQRSARRPNALGQNGPPSRRDGGMVEIKVDPLIASLRGQPRYVALLRAMDLSQ